VRIVDADISVLQAPARRGRLRSEATRTLMDAIAQLALGKAKAVVVPRGESPEKVRARVSYAAKIVGKPVQLAISEDRVMFALNEEERRRGRP